MRNLNCCECQFVDYDIDEEPCIDCNNCDRFIPDDSVEEDD